MSLTQLMSTQKLLASFLIYFSIDFFSLMFEFLCRKLGWDPKTGESHLDAMLRGEVLIALALFGHDPTLNEASRRFQAFLDDKNTPLLPPDTRVVGETSIGPLVFLHLQLLLMYIVGLIAGSIYGCNAEGQQLEQIGF